MASLACNSNNCTVPLETALCSGIPRALCGLCRHRTMWKAEYAGSRFNKTQHLMLHPEFLGQTGMHLVEHTVAASCTPCLALCKELTYIAIAALAPCRQMATQWKGRWGLGILMKTVVALQIPGKWLWDSIVNAALCKAWGPLHSFWVENMASKCCPWIKLRLYIKAKKTTPSFVCIDMMDNRKYTSMCHTHHQESGTSYIERTELVPRVKHYSSP